MYRENRFSGRRNIEKDDKNKDKNQPRVFLFLLFEKKEKGSKSYWLGYAMMS
jgi:hypothetical protein